ILLRTIVGGRHSGTAVRERGQVAGGVVGPPQRLQHRTCRVLHLELGPAVVRVVRARDDGSRAETPLHLEAVLAVPEVDRASVAGDLSPRVAPDLDGRAVGIDVKNLPALSV